VHISELAQHHVENPREVVSQGDTVKVLILEVDGERRRLSLSLKRVEDNSPAGEAPDLGLSEEVFTETPRAEASPEETYEAPENGAAASDSEEAPSEEQPQQTQT
jgi:small subunit ribosomal protein S1